MLRRTLLALATAALVRAAPPQSDSGSFFFIQLSDPQFGMYAKDAGFAQETANYEFAIATVNRLKPRFVIITGDLVNKPGDRAQIEEYFRITGKLDKSIRVFHVPGNHDVGNEPTPESIAAWRERFGPDYYSFQEGPVYGIVLDSSLIHSPAKAQALADAQEKWLSTELENAKASGAQHIVVFQHHPWFIKQATEPDEYFNIPLARRSPLLAAFREAGVKYVFSGHYHRNADATDAGVEAITTGPVGMPLGGAKSGIRVVQISGGTLQHSYFDFGSLPPSLAASK